MGPCGQRIPATRRSAEYARFRWAARKPISGDPHRISVNHAEFAQIDLDGDLHSEARLINRGIRTFDQFASCWRNLCSYPATKESSAAYPAAIASVTHPLPKQIRHSSNQSNRSSIGSSKVVRHPDLTSIPPGAIRRRGGFRQPAWQSGWPVRVMTTSPRSLTASGSREGGFREC